MKTFDEFGSRSAYDKERYERRMQELKDYLGGACVICGSTDRLEFDHIIPETKEFEIASKWNRKFKILEPELKKCRLLCSEHHKTRTLEQISNECGGGLAGRHRCKCKECKEAKARYMKEYWKKRGKIETRFFCRCGAKLDPRGRSKMCRTCSNKARRKAT